MRRQASFAHQLAESLLAGAWQDHTRFAERPTGRVLVDYNQNAWGRTLASVYSVRPKPEAAVSAPLTWEEVGSGIDAASSNVNTMPGRVKEHGDLFKAVLQKRGRCRLEMLQ